MNPFEVALAQFASVLTLLTLLWIAMDIQEESVWQVFRATWIVTLLLGVFDLLYHFYLQLGSLGWLLVFTVVGVALIISSWRR